MLVKNKQILKNVKCRLMEEDSLSAISYRRVMTQISSWRETRIGEELCLDKIRAFKYY